MKSTKFGQLDFMLREDREAAREDFPHPAVMNARTGQLKAALAALDMKDDLLEAHPVTTPKEDIQALLNQVVGPRMSR